MAEPEVAAALARARADAARCERAREHALDELYVCRIALRQILLSGGLLPPHVVQIARRALNDEPEDTMTSHDRREALADLNGKPEAK
jgi:ribosomal protein S14